MAFEAASPEVLTRLAARGLGVAVLPSLPEEMTAGLGLRTLTITDPRPRGRIALTWRTDGPPTPAAQALLSALRKHLTTGAP
ncbi:LysR family transcriptional regulator substrate-binding protein [Streptomyces sp. 135]|uniref:LysR family transcriptional regulator substrate-binding protein n=1 Tax=Streptomyces sp. 135 TaxID=2838850 RepID=UPI003208ECA6